MLTFEEARRIAEAEISWRADGGARVMSDSTITLPYGWVFFWNSVNFLKTGDRRFMLLGNAPLIVNSTDGTTRFTGTAHATSHYLREYEEGIGVRTPVSGLRILRAILHGLWLHATGRRWTMELSPAPDCGCIRCRLSAIVSTREPTE